MNIKTTTLVSTWLAFGAGCTGGDKADETTGDTAEELPPGTTSSTLGTPPGTTTSWTGTTTTGTPPGSTTTDGTGLPYPDDTGHTGYIGTPPGTTTTTSTTGTSRGGTGL